MDTASTTTTTTGSGCLAELRKGGGGFSWNGFSPSGGQLSTIDRNEDNQAQQWKSLSLVVRNRRPRTKRCRRSAFAARRSIPPLFEPKNSLNSRLIKQQRKKLKQLYPLNPMEKSNSCSTKCTHCGVTDTPQWRAGPLGPRTLCNACGVRYKSGRLLPEYRPAASPYFSPTLHSNSHKKVLEMRNKPVNGPYTPVNGPYADNSGTELAAEDIKCSEKVRNKIVESYNEDTMTEVPVGGESKEVVVPYVGTLDSPDNVVVPGGWESKEDVPYVGFLDSPDNVLQRRDDDEEFFEYFFDGIEDNNSMDLIPNIDPLYGLDLSEYCLGDHSLDFDFTF